MTAKETNSRTAITFIVLGLGALVGLAWLMRSADDGHSGERFSQREAIEYCEDNYTKLKEDPRLSREALGIAYGACEQMKVDFRRKWNREP